MDEALPEYWVDTRARETSHALPTRGWLADAVAVAEALFATEAGPPPRDHLAWLAVELEDYVAHLGPRSRLVVRGSFLVISGLAPMLSRRWRPLARLALADRQRVIERLERSPLGLSVLAVRASLCILWYEHPDHAREVGLRPRPRPPRGAP